MNRISQYNGSRLTAHGSRLTAHGSRDTVADSLRGLAIILVVTAHAILSLSEHADISLLPFKLATGYIYSFHMALLFMIAGYVRGIKDYSPDFAGECRKNFVSVYLPCIVFSVFEWGLKHFVFTSYDPEAVAESMGVTGLIISVLGGFRKYWFLSALFFTKIIHAYLERRKLNNVFWITLLFLYLCLYDTAPLFVRRLANGGFFFHAGYLIKRTQSRCPNIVVGIILVIAGAVLSRPAGIFTSRFAVPLSALCSCLGIFTAFYSLKISCHFLAASGLYSMVIYCTHNYSNALLNAFHLPLRLPYPLALYFIYAAAGMLLPFLTVQLYKNVKPIRWLEYLFYPGQFFRP